MPPIALGIHVAQIQLVLQSQPDARQRTCDLARDEGLATHRRFMVEQDAVARIDPVGLAIVHGNPVGVQLGAGIGRARVERRGLLLRYLLDFAEKL